MRKRIRGAFSRAERDGASRGRINFQHLPAGRQGKLYVTDVFYRIVGMGE